MKTAEINDRIKELDEIKAKVRFYRKLDDFADWYLYALNEPLSEELGFWANPSEAAKQLPQEIKNLRFRTIEVLFEVLRHGHFLAYQEGKQIPRCPLCNKHFFAKHKKQTHCPTCSRKMSQKTWRDNYEKEHGHPYQQKRAAGYVKRVRKALENRKDFTPTLENKKDLAAHADVTLKQCEAALEYLKSTKKKRADPARKRR